jgi:outer membrane protein
MTSKNLIDIGIKVVLSAGLVILFILHIESQKSLVYVDAQKLVAGYKGMQAARQEFEKKATVWKSNLDTLRAGVETQIQSYEIKKVSLSAREKQLTEELIQSKQDQYLNYQQVIQEKVQKEDQELTNKVLDTVNDYLKRYGKEKGYRIILAATQYGNIVYAQDGIDITEEVMKGLNDEFKTP